MHNQTDNNVGENQSQIRENTKGMFDIRNAEIKNIREELEAIKNRSINIAGWNINTTPIQ